MLTKFTFNKTLKRALFLLVFIPLTNAQAEHISPSDCETLRYGIFRFQVYQMRTWQHEVAVKNIFEEFGAKPESQKSEFEKSMRREIDRLNKKRTEDSQKRLPSAETLDRLLRQICHY